MPKFLPYAILYKLLLLYMTLCVKPISAFLSRDTQVFSNMDPYVVAIVGSDKQRSQTHNEGGKKPRWNDQFIFRPRASSMLITVYDEDTFSDDVVGSANIELKKYIDNPVQVEENFTLSYKGKNSGTIKLVIKFTPQQKQIWNQNNQKGIVNPTNPYNMKPQPNYNPGVQVPPMPNQGWQAQPNYGNSYGNTNNYGNTWGTQNNNNANWNNQFPQDATNLLLANHIANVTTGQLGQQGQGQVQGLNQNAIWSNILNASIQNQTQPQSQNNQWGNPNTNNGWGSQNNGWGSQNNGWGSQNNGWGSQNDIYRR